MEFEVDLFEYETIQDEMAIEAALEARGEYVEMNDLDGDIDFEAYDEERFWREQDEE